MTEEAEAEVAEVAVAEVRTKRPYIRRAVNMVKGSDVRMLGSIELPDSVVDDQDYHRGKYYVPARKAELWERQPTEGARAFAGFRTFRDMSPEVRTFKRAAAEFHVSIALAHMWSLRWRWLERTAAWDQEVERQENLARLAAIRKATTRHATIGQMLQRQVMTRLQAHEAETLSNKDIDRWAKEGTRIERLALGISEAPSTQINVNTSSQAVAAAKAESSAGSLADQLAADPALLEAVSGGLEHLLSGLSMRKLPDESDETLPGM